MFNVLSVARGAAFECSIIKVPATDEEVIFLCCGLTCSDGIIRLNGEKPAKSVTPTATFVKKQGIWCQKTPRFDTTSYRLDKEAHDKVARLFEAAKNQGRVNSIEAIGAFLTKFPIAE
jgi:hypothetical protein